MTETTKYDVCCLHGGCDDGVGAAWAYRRHVADRWTVEYYDGAYSVPPPDWTGRNVLIVDFSYKRPVMEQIAAQANIVTVLDHHKSAEAELRPLLDGAIIGGDFDMMRSGAMMTWDWFHEGVTPPPLLEYIQDRDLWHKALPFCDEVIMALRSYPQDFDVWDGLMAADIDDLVAEGKSILRYYRTLVDQAKRVARIESIGGHDVPVVNVPHYLASEVAGELCAEHETPFSACYWDRADGGRTFSLRSRGEFDVSQIGVAYGGGGHKGAAGFEIKPDDVSDCWRALAEPVDIK